MSFLKYFISVIFLGLSIGVSADTTGEEVLFSHNDVNSFCNSHECVNVMHTLEDWYGNGNMINVYTVFYNISSPPPDSGGNGDGSSGGGSGGGSGRGSGENCDEGGMPNSGPGRICPPPNG